LANTLPLPQNITDLHVSNEASPTCRSENDVLVNITHAGLNHVDLLYCRGKHQNNRSLVTPPFILGLEFAGIIAAAPGSSTFKPGDRVLGGGVGGFAEQIVVKENTLRKVPDGWSLEDAAGIAATAPVSYGALVQLANVKKGETVLVHAAAGGLGVMAVQIARALGAAVIGTVGSAGKENVVKALGATVVRYDVDDWEQQVLDLTGGLGVDVVYDSLGLVEKSIRCLKFAGRIIIIGFAGLEGKMEKVAMNRILLKSARVFGYVSTPQVRSLMSNVNDVRSALERLADGFQPRPKRSGEVWKTCSSKA
jgi:NADPH2:quinone reductase